MLSYPADTKIVSIHLWIKEETILNNEKSALAQRYVRKLVKLNEYFFLIMISLEYLEFCMTPNISTHFGEHICACGLFQHL